MQFPGCQILLANLRYGVAVAGNDITLINARVDFAPSL